MELITVIAILALLAAITMPAGNRMLASMRLESDARQMAALLRLARSEAISTGQPNTVVFYTSSAKYRLLGYNYHSLNTGIRFIGTTSFTSKLNGLPICGFSPLGVPTSGGTVTLSNGFEYRYVIVNPVMGRIRVSSSPPGS